MIYLDCLILWFSVSLVALIALVAIVTIGETAADVWCWWRSR